MEKIWTIPEIKEMLATNRKWIERAIVVITEENQTHTEQINEYTKDRNGIGWNGYDASILTSFAKQIKMGRTLSEKQMNIAKKKLPKYAKQVLALIEKKEEKQVTKPVMKLVTDIKSLVKYID